MHEKKGPLLRPTVWCFAVLACWGSVAYAGEWNTNGRLPVSLGYSTNVTQSNSDRDRVAGGFFETQPGIGLHGRGGRVQLDFDYSYLASERRGDGSHSDHRLSSLAKAELVDNLMFVDASANVTQERKSLLDSSTLGSAPNNSSDVISYDVSPYFRHAFGSFAVGNLRFDHNRIFARGEPTFSASTGDSVGLTLNSGAAFSLIGWSASYDRERVEYRDRPDANSQRASGRLNLRADSAIQFFAQIGWEKINDDALDASPNDRFWSVGTTWRPTQRTDISLSYGKRFFGNTWSAVLNERTRWTAWSLSYSQDLTSTRQQFLVPIAIPTNTQTLDALFQSQIPDQAARTAAVNNYIAANGANLFVAAPLLSNRSFIERALQASVGLNAPKHTVLLSGFAKKRLAQLSNQAIFISGGDFQISDDIRQDGASVSWNWRFGSRTAFNAAVSKTRDRFISSGIAERQMLYQTNLSYRFQPKVSGIMELRRTSRDSTESGRDMAENSLMFTLLTLF